MGKQMTKSMIRISLSIALLAILMMAYGIATAAPTITADPYPATAPQPASITLTVNGTTGPACTLAAGSGGALVPTCDLASLPAGTHTLVMTAVFVRGCVSATNTATCTDGGTASAAPFSYTRRALSASGPDALRVVP
jgi:hypothetical protein